MDSSSISICCFRTCFIVAALNHSLFVLFFCLSFRSVFSVICKSQLSDWIMSGYSAELFLENVDQEFLCGIWWVNVIPAFFFFLQQFLSLCMERFQWRYNPPTVLVLRKEAFFAWAVCCTITDHMICSREWFSLHPSKNNLFTYTQLFEHLIEWFLKNIITLSEMGKQSAQAKNVYLTIIHQRHSEYC